MTIEAKVVHRLLVEGVAPDGKQFELSSIFGEWSATRTPDQSLALYQRGTMIDEEIESFWQYTGRSDPQPQSLKIYLKVNPEFVDWIMLDQAGQFLMSKLSERPQSELAVSLQRAFAAGHIRTRNLTKQLFEEGYTVELNTRDFVRWLDYEYNIKVTKYAVACYPEDPLVFELLTSAPRKKRKR
jgi:hypothetical protein